MPHIRILLAIIAGGLASPMLASPLEACLRHETPDAAILAYGLAPVIVAVLAFGATALFGSPLDAGPAIHTSVQLDGRKIGSAVTRRAQADTGSCG